MNPPGASSGDPSDPLTGIAGAGSVAAIFGRWPSFHDAEVCAFAVAVGPDGFSVTVALHAFAVTADVDERGNYELTQHTRVTFRFHECTDLQLDHFDRHTVLFALHLSANPAVAGKSWTVLFENSSGPDASLNCRWIEVVEAVPWVPPPAASGT